VSRDADATICNTSAIESIAAVEFNQLSVTWTHAVGKHDPRRHRMVDVDYDRPTISGDLTRRVYDRLCAAFQTEPSRNRRGFPSSADERYLYVQFSRTE